MCDVVFNVMDGFCAPLIHIRGLPVERIMIPQKPFAEVNHVEVIFPSLNNLVKIQIIQQTKTYNS
jgi:hypothetical protein